MTLEIPKAFDHVWHETLLNILPVDAMNSLPFEQLSHGLQYTGVFSGTLTVNARITTEIWMVHLSLKKIIKTFITPLNFPRKNNCSLSNTSYVWNISIKLGLLVLLCIVRFFYILVLLFVCYRVIKIKHETFCRGDISGEQNIHTTETRRKLLYRNNQNWYDIMQNNLHSQLIQERLTLDIGSSAQYIII